MNIEPQKLNKIKLLEILSMQYVTNSLSFQTIYKLRWKKVSN